MFASTMYALTYGEKNSFTVCQRHRFAQKVTVERDGHAGLGQLAISVLALNDYKIGTCDFSMSEVATWPRAGNPGRFEFLGNARRHKRPSFKSQEARQPAWLNNTSSR